MQASSHQSDEPLQPSCIGPAASAAQTTGQGTAVPAEQVTSDILPDGGTPLGRVDELLHPVRTQEYQQAYLQEYQPIGPTEHALVRQLAIHAAAADLWNEAVGAIERQGALELPGSPLLAGKTGAALHDAVLAGTMSQEPVDRGEKHLRHHLRSFHRTLDKLQQLQLHRRSTEAGEITVHGPTGWLDYRSPRPSDLSRQ
jgi:hypothetical protein